MAINVGAVFSVVELAKKMKNLKALIHVSTAYCNTHLAWWEMIRKSFFKLRPFPHNYLKTLSVPEEIVDNSDLGDPEGMLQLSRVTSSLWLEIDSLNLLHILGFWMWIDIFNKTLHLIDQYISADDGSKCVQFHDEQADWQPTKLLHLHKGASLCMTQAVETE